MDSPVKDRRDQFIQDIIEVCRNHRVLIRADWEALESLADSNLPMFCENHKDSQFNFNVNIADLEHAVRIANWDEIHDTQSEEK